MISSHDFTWWTGSMVAFLPSICGENRFSTLLFVQNKGVRATKMVHQHRKVSFGENLVLCGTAPACAAIFTNPMDMARVQMQLNGEKGAKAAYTGTVDCIKKVFRAEGLRGVQRGLTTAFVRESMQNIPRLGLYGPIMTQYKSLSGASENAPDTFLNRLATGATTGVCGGLFSNPAEVIKARIQSGRYSYSNPFSAAREILRKEGVASLMKGWDACAFR
jgi:solute carrier family 25 protein 34/35